MAMRRIAVLAGVVAATAVGCGGDDGTDEQIVEGVEDAVGDAGDAGDTDAADAVEAPDGMELDGLPLVDGLIPELAGLPVPDGTAFQPGDAYDEDVDPRATAVQMLFFPSPPHEVAAFYLDELPAAGYPLDSGGGGAITDPAEIVPDEPVVIWFTTPDGHPGQLVISPSFLAPAQMNVNVYRSGVR